MKKILAFVLVFVMALSFVACGNGNGDGNGGEDEKTTLVGAVVVKAVGSIWFDSMGWETDAWGETIGDRGYELKNNYLGPTSQDSAAQLQVLADAIALNPDILCVVPIAADAVDEQLAIAKANGATVVTHEGGTLQNIDYNVDAFAPDAYGAHFAKLLAEYGGETGKVAITVGSLTEVSHNQWAQALYDSLQENYPGWESVTGGDFIESGATDSAYENGKQLIQAYPDLNCIWVGSASATMGYARAIEEMGKTGEIMLIGNASAQARADAWENEILTHTCFWYPGYSAAAAYEVALRIIEGREIKTGDDLGVKGFENIIVDGKNIYGSGWYDVTADNWEEMAEIM